MIGSGADENYNDLFTALRASESRTLSLPAAATFEPLESSSDVALGGVGSSSNIFSSHITHQLPCDARSRGHGRGRIGSYDLIHCFTLAPELAASLNDRLNELALHREADARESAGEDDGSPSSVSLSNWGGFQSDHQIFDAFEDDPTEREAFASCRELHGIASAAMDELIGAREGGALHPLYGWINVNRSSDLNFLHVHAPDRWSAVYFVDGGMWSAAAVAGAGEPACEPVCEPVCEAASACSSMGAEEDDGNSSSADSARGDHPGSNLAGHLAGHLVFRGGRPLGEPTFGGATNTYLGAPPNPGTLWLFPGLVPHGVLGHGVPPRTSAEEEENAIARLYARARVSVAINFEEAEAPTPAWVSCT